MNIFGELLDLCARQFSARFRSGKFLVECRDSAFRFGKRQLQLLQSRAALGSIFLDFSGQTGELRQLGFVLFQAPLDFRNRLVGLLDRGVVLFAFVFSVGDVAPRAFGQLRHLLRALAIEFDAAAVRSDFAFQSLHFRS